MHISPVHIVYIVRNVHHPHLHGSLWMTRLEPHAEDGCDQCGCGVRVKYGRNIHINWHELVSFCHCLSSMQVLISEYSPSTKAQLKPIHLSARLFVVPRIKGSSICHFSTEGVGMLQKLSWSTDWKGSKTWEIASLPDMWHMYGCHLGVYWFSVCVCVVMKGMRVLSGFFPRLCLGIYTIAVEWSILIGVNSIDRALPHCTTVKLL